MISLCFLPLFFLLDSSLCYITSSLVLRSPVDLLSAVWLVYVIKAPILTLLSSHLPRPQWIPSGLLYVLTFCFAPPLYQTLRFFLTSQPPELHSVFSSSLLYHLPLLLSCLVWDLILPSTKTKETSAEDEKEQSRRKNFIRLVKLSKPDWMFLCPAFVFLTLALIFEMSIPYYTGRMIDILSNKYKETEFLAAVIYMAVLTISSSVSTGCRGGFFIFCLFRLTRRLRVLLFRAFVKQDIAFFETTKTGDISSRLTNDTALVSRSIAGNVNITLRTVIKCIGYYVFMFSISWQLTLLSLFSMPLISIVQSMYNKYHEDLVKRVQDSIASSCDLAKEIVESVKTVQSFAAEEEEVKRYEESLKKTHILQIKRDTVRALYLLIIRIINLAAQVSVLCYGHALILSGKISTGAMVSFIIYQMESNDYLRSLIHMISEITHSAGVASKVFQYLDRVPQVSTSGSHRPKDLRGEFEFQNVTFCYPSRPDTPAVQDISFHLPPGSVTALVGPSGGGKTTCVSLLERFYEPQSGEILLDGRPLAEYDHQYLHSKVALVAQDPVLFAGTVKENISYGLNDKSDQQVTAAARQAKAETFISNLEKAYDTDVGDSGAQMGAGQKQRIALARALARKPKLLILDEASSCLDVETEHEIQQSVQSIPGLSVLIIAHRLRTVQSADQILVLEGGRVVERGNHDELKQRKGTYYKLLQNGD
ncbi:antigen peptide transporter 2 [Hyla sarda]|uniref:antigen peptide transporter 2 n=1 Tax=Hyla sarda TaxID=327740 RepID=UPI0024C314BA|nr:antigen peptide transporter 2 [Hyla sarda]XP_056394465.1 antigen peptide transporter 2 [Hyla sarda]XP_056394466.1 antigen peptide transporter 2 [Hyla sarda]XP_056394467.1 antigen peptide transporter 2 [Hyla sarda]